MRHIGGIPIFLFSLIGGVVADRVERRKILLGSQWVQMATASILTSLVATGSLLTANTTGIVEVAALAASVAAVLWMNGGAIE